MIKTKKVLIWIVAVLPLIATLLFLPHLADKIPVHYGTGGEVDRWGSKYEILIAPFFAIAVVALIEIINKLYKHPKKEQNKKALFVCEIVVLFILNALNALVLYYAYTQTTNINSADIDVFKVVAIVLSIAWILLGNVLPKTKRNSFLGIRTAWTLADDTVWYKTHRLGGFLFTGFGLLSLILSIFLKGIIMMAVALGGIIVIIIAIIIYSYKIYKREV